MAGSVTPSIVATFGNDLVLFCLVITATLLGAAAMTRRAAGKPEDRPNMICGPVQICWHKFARYWDIELREIPMEGDRLLMTA